jgi:hypothetical protein
LDPVRICGTVTREAVDAGSKSERDAVVLKTDDDRSYVLRRRGGPAFGDSVLDELVGTSIAASGLDMGNLLIMSDWEALD